MEKYFYDIHIVEDEDTGMGYSVFVESDMHFDEDLESEEVIDLAIQQGKLDPEEAQYCDYVSEIDEKMTELAKTQFGLDINNPRLKIYHQDGRSFLNYTNNKYDTILIDAFKGLNAPFELTTYEALVNASNKLNDNGMVITNIISAIEGEKSDFIKYEYATYKKVFKDVKIFKVKNIIDTEEQNLILIGFKGKTNENKEKYEQYKSLLEREITNFESDKQVVTDNYAPIGN